MYGEATAVNGRCTPPWKRGFNTTGEAIPGLAGTRPSLREAAWVVSVVVLLVCCLSPGSWASGERSATLEIIEIRVPVEDETAIENLPAWQSRTRRDGSTEWSVRDDLYPGEADAYVFVRFDRGADFFRAAVVPLNDGTARTELYAHLPERPGPPPMWLALDGPRLLIFDDPVDEALCALLSGDTWSSDRWPGVTVVYHPRIGRDELLLFRIFIDGPSPRLP